MEEEEEREREGPRMLAKTDERLDDGYVVFVDDDDLPKVLSIE